MFLQTRQKDGATLREHLERVPFDRLSIDDRELMAERAHPTARHLWPVYIDIASTRRAGFGGAEPIGFDQVLSWQALYGRRLLAWEVRALFRIDQRARTMAAEANSE